ncbi:hypothetical protein LTR37_005104 [Vermiconidia calcicola]|uniref:Uncharacterized protein n=1 Tax=Vermiconidia calcicola TaxID=1690605 RepID=A0ACC3NKG5_9PEZI|nr:hypothetical protein LTR37_005104 [Vermiconidia calcicola]
MASQDTNANTDFGHNPSTSVSHGDKGRSGSGNPDLFNSIQSMKRSAGNSKAQDNRQSLQDQSVTKGMAGQMWDKFTRGQQEK